MIVALSGADGTGKTTVGREIKAQLLKPGLKVDYFVSFRYKFVGSILKGKSVSTSDEILRRVHDGGFLKALYRLWPFVVFLDQISAHLVMSIQRKTITICDRCFLDFLVSYEVSDCSSSIVRWLFLHFPKPDTGFVLDVDPKVALTRKGEDVSDINLAFQIKLRSAYLSFGRKLGFMIVDTSEPQANTIRKVLDALLPCINLSAIKKPSLRNSKTRQILSA